MEHQHAGHRQPAAGDARHRHEGREADRRVVDVDLRRRASICCVECGEVAPPRTHRGTAQGEALGSRFVRKCGRDLAPIPTDESKPLQRQLLSTRFRRKIRKRWCCSSDEPTVCPGGAALLQHLWHAPGALESVHGSCGDLCVAFAERACADGVSKTAIRCATSSVFTTLCTPICWPWRRSEADGMALNVGSGEPISVREVASAFQLPWDWKSSRS